MKIISLALNFLLISYCSFASSDVNNTYNQLADAAVAFTPTSVGWYRIATVAFPQGGSVEIMSNYDNRVTDLEFQYNIGSYAVGGSIQQTRYSSYNTGNVDQVRISSDGLANTYLDIHISSANTPGVVYIVGHGMLMPSFVPSPVVGATQGSTDVSVLTVGHGFNSTQGANLAQSGGNVGIGTTHPDAKLAVKGTIHTQEVKVDMIGWNDIVFDKSYPLPELSLLKTYIDKNHHLPEIPPEAEVIKNGVNLGEMVKIQTKKIEELTLYLINKDKELKDQQAENKKQNRRIAALEIALTKLSAKNK